MATLSLGNSTLGNALMDILGCDEIQPGDPVSYQTCKTLYLYHPLGRKLVEAPITMAQSQKRIISIPGGPEEKCQEAFNREWVKLGCDNVIFDTMRLSRIYGVSTLAMLERGREPSSPVQPSKLWEADIVFNRLDPLNTSGSLVLNQDPNALDFLKTVNVAVNSVPYHPSRTVIQMHEDPIYISYTSSGFGYTGRSVYQRSLFPLKSFIQSMITDDMVTLKAGVIVAKMKQPGSVVDAVMQKLAGIKRNFVKEAVIGNVLGITPDEDIETLNFTNLDGPMGMARKNILENIAVANDMPAKILNSETFAEGFGEGTEDAKNLARYVDRFRTEMKPLYDFMDRVVMLRAWNPDWYKDVIQRCFPEFKNVPYESAFYRFANSFHAEWPNLLEEPDSEKIKVDESKQKAIVEIVAELKGDLDPDNKAKLFQWAADNLNANKKLWTTPLELDWEALAEYVPPMQQLAEDQEAGAPDEGEGDKQPKPKTKPQLTSIK